jgi:hypothetical protein
MCDFKSHLKDHSADVLLRWKEKQPWQCLWAGCKSKAVFRYVHVLQAHLDNIHVNPLVCAVRNCSHQTPFRSNYDLKRHMRTAHSGEQDLQIFCPYPNCDKDPKSFVRKDKWLSHIRSCHQGDSCPLHHCDFVQKDRASGQAGVVEHIKKFHGNYECGIGSCRNEPQSRFAEFELLKHLELHHGIAPNDITAAGNAARASLNHTIKSKDIQSHYGDCKYCRIKTAKSIARFGQKS